MREVIRSEEKDLSAKQIKERWAVIEIPFSNHFEIRLLVTSQGWCQKVHKELLIVVVRKSSKWSRQILRLTSPSFLCFHSAESPERKEKVSNWTKTGRGGDHYGSGRETEDICGATEESKFSFIPLFLFHKCPNPSYRRRILPEFVESFRCYCSIYPYLQLLFTYVCYFHP